MAQDVFANVTASTSRGPDGKYAHTSSFASASAADLTVSWDHTKFSTRQALLDAFVVLMNNVAQLTTLPR